jgi:PIN domain nuclease of toxin-antitoxin system
MNLLIDTHVAIWSISDSDRLPPHIAVLIADRANTVFVSAASLFEIAIKRRLGRKTAPPFSASFAKKEFDELGFVLLPISAEHVLAVESLDFDHADPFDRLILAQALSEPLILVTKDRQLSAYGNTIVSW